MQIKKYITKLELDNKKETIHGKNNSKINYGKIIKSTFDK